MIVPIVFSWCIYPGYDEEEIRKMIFYDEILQSDKFIAKTQNLSDIIRIHRKDSKLYVHSEYMIFVRVKLNNCEDISEKYENLTNMLCENVFRILATTIANLKFGIKSEIYQK